MESEPKKKIINIYRYVIKVEDWGFLFWFTAFLTVLCFTFWLMHWWWLRSFIHSLIHFKPLFTLNRTDCAQAFLQSHEVNVWRVIHSKICINILKWLKLKQWLLQSARAWSSHFNNLIWCISLFIKRSLHGIHMIMCYGYGHNQNIHCKVFQSVYYVAVILPKSGSCNITLPHSECWFA